MIDSYGYQVLSLRDLIEALEDLAVKHPELAEKPVWVGNVPPTFMPVKWAILPRVRPEAGVHIIVEKG